MTNNGIEYLDDCLSKTAFICLIFVSSMMFVSVQAESQTAMETVKSNTDQLTKKLVEIKPLYPDQKERFYEEVESTLSPVIDFKGFSRGVMAKYYRSASEEQRQKFAQKFKGGLIRTYAEAMVKFKNEKMEVMSESPGKKPGRATVKMVFHGSDGTLYPVEYSMVLKDGEWLLKNIVINGINIGLQFKSQFSALMQKYRNNIDEVIANWDTKVKASE